MDLRLLRLQHRISQRLIARLAGISQSQVVRIENGSGPVSQQARDRYERAIRRLEERAS